MSGSWKTTKINPLSFDRRLESSAASTDRKSELQWRAGVCLILNLWTLCISRCIFRSKWQHNYSKKDWFIRRPQFTANHLCVDMWEETYCWTLIIIDIVQWHDNLSPLWYIVTSGLWMWKWCLLGSGFFSQTLRPDHKHHCRKFRAKVYPELSNHTDSTWTSRSCLNR